MVRRTCYILIGMALLFLVSCGSEGGRDTGDEGGGSGYRVAMGGLYNSAVQITNAPGDQSQADSAFSTHSDLYFLVWSDARAMSTNSLDIYGTFVNATTGIVNGPELAIATTTGNQIQPSVAYDTANKRFLVAYTNTVDGHIYGRFINGATHDFTGMGSNFVISMYNTTVNKWIPFDSGWEYHPDGTMRETVGTGDGSSTTFSKALTLPSASPGIINIPGSFYYNDTAIESGTLSIIENSVSGSKTVGHDNPLYCDSFNRCLIQGSRTALIGAVERIGLGTGSNYSFTSQLANSPIDTSSLSFQVYYGDVSLGNIVGRGDGLGGVSRVTSGAAVWLPKIDPLNSTISSANGAYSINFLQSTAGFPVGTGDGTSTGPFLATLTNTPITPGTLKIYVDGSQVGTDNGSGGFPAIAPIQTGTVDYQSGAVSLTFTSAIGNTLAITANHSTDAPANGLTIYARYNTLLQDDIFDPESYIDYVSGTLYLKYISSALPGNGVDIEASYTPVQNRESRVSQSYQFTYQESPRVVYNNVRDTFHVVWLDTTDKNRNGLYVIPGTNVCTNVFSDASIITDSSDEGQEVFFFYYTNDTAIDTKMVRYRDVSFADYYNGDGLNAGGGLTQDYTSDMDNSYDHDHDGTLDDINWDNIPDRDFSPIDSQIVDASAFTFGSPFLDVSCTATAETYKIVITVQDSEAESSPAITFNPVTGNPVVLWSSSEQELESSATWTRGVQTGGWEPWGPNFLFTDSQTATQAKQKIHAIRHEFDTRYDSTYTVTDSTAESAPSAATDIYKNRMLMVWESQGTEGKDIYGQLVDLQSFSPYGTMFGISTDQFDQSAPRVSFDTVNQRYMVLWEDARNTEVNISNMDIFGQFVDPQGQLSGSNFPVTVTTSNQISPAVCFGDFEQSKFLVAWKDGSVPGDAEIYGQLWNFSQAPQMVIKYDDDGDGEATPLYTQAIDYGGINVGYSNTVTFYIENLGNAPLTVSAITNGAGVSFSENAAIPFIILTAKPNTINPGVSYPMQVMFHPPQVQTYSGGVNSITLTSDGGTTTIYFSGFGIGLPVQITTPALPDGAKGAYYSATLIGAGGSPPYVWNTVSAGVVNSSILAGMGLSLNKNNGVISGTISSTAFSNTITVRLKDAAGSTAEKDFYIFVGDFSISTTTLPAGQVGVSYTTTLTAAGSPSIPLWSDDGRLPPGLTLDSSSGTISGSPTTQGTYLFTITLTDASSSSVSKDLTIVVDSSLVIASNVTPLTDPVALPNAVRGQYYEQYVMATANGTLPYAWTLAGGTYPSGLTLSTSSGSVVILNGIVADNAAPSYAFILRVTDYTGNTAERIFTMSVSNLRIDTQSLPDGLVGQSYTTTLSASGGAPPYTWTLKGTDTLPSGLTLGQNSGVIAGTVLLTTINKSFTVVVEDGFGAQAEKTFTLSFRDIAITTSSPLSEGFQNEAYSNTLTGIGGAVANYVWSMSGSTLPTGLTGPSPTTGVISGTPTVSGAFTFTIQLSDGSQSTTKAFTLNLVPALSITTGSPLSYGTLGTAYSATLAGTGGKGTYAWSWNTANAPPGLALATTGAISGAPTTVGSYNFNVTLTDTTTTKFATKAFDMSIVNSSAITPPPPATTPTETGAEAKSACYIATAAYGSYLDPHVEALREFRDSRLMTNAFGRKFVALYYRTSPPIADYIAERPALRTAVRTALAPIVYWVKYPVLGFAMIMASAAAGYGLRRRRRRK